MVCHGLNGGLFFVLVFSSGQSHLSQPERTLDWGSFGRSLDRELFNGPWVFFSWLFFSVSAFLSLGLAF